MIFQKKKKKKELWRTDESNSITHHQGLARGGRVVLSENPRGRRSSCLILIVKAMEERLNERWEFYYDNRLKHPSEEQEENIRQIDFHKIIKSDGVMYLLTLSTKILEKAKTFSKDGSFNFSYIYAARAEKVVEKIKRTAPKIMSNDTYKRLYLKVLETCHDFKNKAKENIMEI